MNVGDLALSNLFDATGDDQPIDSKAIRAKGRAVRVEEQVTEADCARVMAQIEKKHRSRPSAAGPGGDGSGQPQQALHPVGAVTGIAKCAAGQVGALGQASAAAGM